MNWAFTLLFILVFFIQSSLLGETILTIGEYESPFEKRIIAGYYGFFFLVFITYLPFLLLKKGWDPYFLSLSIVLGIIDLLCIFIIRKKLFRIPQWHPIQFIKENWVIFGFVLLMTAFAMSNNLSYYHLNYDDTFYIGKIVNTVQTPQFFNENYYNGSILRTFSYGLDRLLGTYEIGLAYLATLFRIHIPFFARVSMNLVNYFMVGITFKEITKFIVKKEYAQYSVLALYSFVLPYGFIQAALKWFCIRSYDLWQFQTAMFYGGSMVRVLSIPTLFIFAYPMIKKMSIKQTGIIALFCITFFSFSSIFIPNFILFAFGIICVKFVYSIVINVKEKNWKWVCIYTLGIIAQAGILYASKQLANVNIPFLMTQNYADSLNQLNGFYQTTLSSDFIFRFGFVPLLLGLIFFFKEKRLYVLFVAILYGIMVTPFFNELMLYASFNYHFVVLRSIASIQFMIFIIYGILFAYALEKINKLWIPNLFTFGYTVALIALFTVLYNYILTFNTLGSGIHKDGWNFTRLIDIHTEMIPDTAVEVGHYFNSLPYGNYNLYTTNTLTEGNKTFESGNFVLASNRIVINLDYGFGEFNAYDNSVLESFCNRNAGDIEIVEKILKENKVDYILVNNKEARDQLREKYKEIIEINGHSLIKISEY